MPQRIFIAALLIFTFKGFGQNASKIFNEVKEVRVRSIGSIKTNNQVKGYYAFYEYDKASRKNLVYKLNILDENLNELGSKEIEGSVDLHLVSSRYDGKNFCFKFWNENTRSSEIKVYNQDGQEVVNSVLRINYKPNTNMRYQGYSQMVSPELNVAENNGFVDYMFNDDNDGFFVRYVEGNAKRSWNRPYEPQGKFKAMVPTFLNGDNEMMLTAVASIGKGMMNMKAQNSILASSTKDGQPLFDIPTDFNDNHIVPINAVFENDKITIIGLNYTSSKTYTSPPDGIAFIEIDRKGKMLKNTIKSFEETLGKYIRMEDHKLRDGYFLFIHDVIRTNRNTTLVVAEQFKPPVGALALGNLILIEYDKNNEVVQAKEIPKQQGTAVGYPSLPFVSVYLAAFVANNFGAMDYLYSLSNEDNSEITFSFVEYNVNRGSRKAKNFGQVKYKDGKLTSDKVAIKNSSNAEADFTRIFPAKPGFILEADYYRDKKELTMNFIKLNN